MIHTLSSFLSYCLSPFRALRYWLREQLQPQNQEHGSAIVKAYVISLGITALTGVLVWLFEQLTKEKFSNLSVMFLIPVLYNTVRYGPRCAFLSSIFALFIFDFFFLPPVLGGFNYSADNMVKFMVFIAAILFTHLLAGEIREYSLILRKDKREISLLHKLSEALADVYDQAGIILTAEQQISKLLHINVHIVSGAYTPVEDECTVPLRTTRQTYGTLVLNNITPAIRRLGQADFKVLSQLLAAQVSISMERAALHEEKEQALVQAERERIRNAVLTSISHDLKTPLASIIGAITTFEAAKNTIAPVQKDILITAIHNEAERLNGFITNLLQVTKLESGDITLNRIFVDIEEIIDRAIRHLHRKLAHYHLITEIPSTTPLLYVDAQLMEQVFVNLLDNACKYTAETGRIYIRVYTTKEEYCIEVEDEGIGIADAEKEKIFDKFHRVYHKDFQVAGTGLGLFISRTIVTLLDGNIEVVSPSKRSGALLRIAFPLRLTKEERIIFSENDEVVAV